MTPHYTLPSLEEFQHFGEKSLEYFNRLLNLDDTTSKQIISNIFKDVVLEKVATTIESKYEDFKKGKGVAFQIAEKLSSETILECMYKFRKAIDDIGLGQYLDLALSAAALAIVGCVAYYCPPLVFVITGTKILEKMQDFLTTDSLKIYKESVKVEKENIENLRNIGKKYGVDKANNLKTLFNNYAQYPQEKQQIIYNYEDLQDKNKAQADELIKKINNIVKIIPNNKELDNTAKELKQSLLQQVDSNNLASRRLQKKFDEAFDSLKSKLNKENKIFNKGKIIYDSYNEFEEIIKIKGSINQELKTILEKKIFISDHKNFLKEIEDFSRSSSTNAEFLKSIGYHGVSQKKQTHLNSKVKSSKHFKTQTNKRSDVIDKKFQSTWTEVRAQEKSKVNSVRRLRGS